MASVIVANNVDVARLRDRVLTEGKSPVGAECREVQSRAAGQRLVLALVGFMVTAVERGQLLFDPGQNITHEEPERYDAYLTLEAL